jgi:hypothetical protein
MRIGLVTNWDDHCAVSDYAHNLVENVTRICDDVDFKIITPPMTFESVKDRTVDCDIIHYNYCAHVFQHMDPVKWHTLRHQGKPVLMTYHESSDWMTRLLAKRGVADILIIHDRLRDGMPQPENVRTINFGVPEVDVSDISVVPNTVGTFGCAFPWKGLLPLAYVCGQSGYELRAFLSEPTSEEGKIGWEILKREISELCNAQIEVGWHDPASIVQKLAFCSVVAFPFDERAPIQGISASVRYGLAAKRPLVLTRFFHFSDLYDWENIYWSEDDELSLVLGDAMFGASRGIADVPYRAIKEMSWTNSAKKYVDLYREVTIGKSFTVGQS